MEKIKIVHLYYDLMNLYGENGNMRALVKALENQGLDVSVDFKTVDDKINLKKYDFIYIGSGLEESLEICLNDFKKYTDDFISCINTGTFVLATGNSLELISALKILDYQTKKIDFRIIGEQVYTTKYIDKKIIGFQNRDSIITNNNEDYLFECLVGCGYEPNVSKEGIRKNNFYGTYLLGPILIRNPYFLEYIVKSIVHSKGLKYKKNKPGIAYQAYEEYLKHFVDIKA